ncbi:MAG TPA: SagB family peptide dehydrogenase [Pirellulales bacterium]|nr:SagB family peptide dehydrogenase [Pirellulales bacterium]
MTATLWLSWQDKVSLSAGDGQAVVAGPASRFAMRSVAPEIVAAMRRLSPPGEEEQRLAESVLAAGSVHSLARWFYHLDQLRRRGLIRRSLHADGRLMATLVPLCRSPGSAAGAAAFVRGREGRRRTWDRGAGRGARPSGTSYRLSRFAYLRREGREMVVESPLAHARVLLHDPRAAVVIAALGAPATAEQLAEQAAPCAPDSISSLVALLLEAGMVHPLPTDDASDPNQPADSEPADSEPADLASWEFHDLLFHARSRRGRSDGQFGGTFRLAHRPPPPALKTTCDREKYELHVPDLERLKRDDPPLALVQERRRSVRRYAAPPITAEQLGEFLYRVARVTGHRRSEMSTPSGPVSMDFMDRPYPAGGGLYELEFYLAVSACRSLPPGLYHYDPVRHGLDRVCELTGDVEGLLAEAALSAGIGAETLQVLVVLAARFQRIAWKYESIAYALILKHVGVVYQTMYLAATAMGLAPCALGCGDSDLFARAAGTDYYAETSVGEFLLGSGE